jgi:ATP-dependent Lhr-like helicase
VSELVDPVMDPTKRWHARAQMLLDRYGLVTREAATAEGLAGGFGPVGQVLRAMEEAGKIRRGYFVDGLHGLQFAHAGAVDRLRASASDPEGEVMALAATDPANPYGAVVPWPATRGDHGARPSRRAGASVILVGGRVALYLHAGRHRLQSFAEASDDDLARALTDGLAALLCQQRRRSLRLAEIDGLPATRSPLAPVLERAGFTRGYQELVGDRIHMRKN